MTDLPAAERTEITDRLLPSLLTSVRTLTCDGGTTVKTLWRLFDGALVESVLMRYPGSGGGTASSGRVTMCVSSQAGCGMACPFCATGQAGLTRNLSTAEIVGQVVAGARMLARGEVDGRPRPSLQRRLHGHGRAARANSTASSRRAPAHRPGARRARHVPARHHGLDGRAGARDQASSPQEDLAVTLAVSLHAPDDELRDELVPVNTRWKVAEVLDAAWGTPSTPVGECPSSTP